jgi:hypothetical protein
MRRRDFMLFFAGAMAARPLAARAAEGDAGDRSPQHRVAPARLLHVVMLDAS